jgi:hypothetical protein
MGSAWDRAHPEKIREYKKRYVLRNREKLRIASLKKYYENREAYAARGKAWAKKNPDKVKAGQRRHDAKPHRKLPRGNYAERSRRWHKKHPEYRCNSEARRRRDPAERAADAIHRKLRHIVSASCPNSDVSALGYNGDDFRQHLAAQFLPGMSWSNYGEWHIDHIKPRSTFCLPGEIVACFALSNLRPLWARDNVRHT